MDPTSNQYPASPYCCVLRLDPCQYTVSVVQEIIYANHILGVTNIHSIEIALFNETNTPNVSMLRVYFTNTWISLNQTNTSAAVSSESVNILFSSSFYNFAAQFTEQVEFNFSSLRINLDQLQLDSPVLELEISPSSPVLTRSLQYNLTGLCGPIF